MLRFLLIIGLIAYAVFKIGSLFFKAGAASQRFRENQRPNVDTNGKQKKDGKIKGGEYVDYEDVK